jgi:hypothetical protein
MITADQHRKDTEEILRLEIAGHTNHCASRQVWGDGECECRSDFVSAGKAWDIVILTHPLRPFFEAVIAEYERGILDYGPWSELSDEQQVAAVRSECFEWMAAELKTRNRTQREQQELTHLANVAGKRWVEIGKGLP